MREPTARYRTPSDLFELPPTTATHPRADGGAAASAAARDAGRRGVVWFDNFGSSCDLRQHLLRHGLDTSADLADFRERGGIVIGRRVGEGRRSVCDIRRPGGDVGAGRGRRLSVSVSALFRGVRDSGVDSGSDASFRSGRRWFGRKRRSSASDGTDGSASSGATAAFRDRYGTGRELPSQSFLVCFGANGH